MDSSDSDCVIDAVVPWVDGADENHRKKREDMLNEQPKARENELITGRDKTRFIDNGELKYCLRSIRTFAPWIHTIHLLTDNQKPDFLTQEMISDMNVKLVDHREIFKGYEWALPTFNNRTIETAIWRIPDLAERFIFFNDDFLLTAPVDPHHFFRGEKVILRGHWNRAAAFGPVRMRFNDLVSNIARKTLGITRSMHHLLQIRSARMAGFSNRYYRAPHVPHPVKTETARRFFQDHPETFERNIRYRFRNMDQFSLVFLANHLEIGADNAILEGTDDVLMINGEMDFRFQIHRKLARIKRGAVHFVCLQGVERIHPKSREQLIHFLDQLLT